MTEVCSKTISNFRNIVMSEVYLETLFNFLYNDVDGYAVSHNARSNHGNVEAVKELMYGEVPFATMKEIIERANPQTNGDFFDLGSGTGRVVIATHMLSKFRKSIGVELLKGLHDKSLEIQKKFNEEVKPKIAELVQDRELEFINQNIFEVDLKEADMIFMNHPFKDRDLFEKIEEKFLQELKPQTKIVTTIRALRNPAFKSLGSKKYLFSWGESTVFFHEI